MMSMHRQVAARMVAAGAGAALALLVWELWLRDRDAEARAAEEARGRAAAEAAISAPAKPLVDRKLVVGAIVLCDAPGAVPEAMVEWQLLADARLVQRKAAPLPTAPGRVPVVAAAVVLPVRELANLAPSTRAALLDLLSSLWSERPIPADRLLLQGVAGDLGDREALLAWLR